MDGELTQVCGETGPWPWTSKLQKTVEALTRAKGWKHSQLGKEPAYDSKGQGMREARAWL